MASGKNASIDLDDKLVDVSSPDEGQFWWRNDLKRVRVWNGSSVVEIAEDQSFIVTQNGHGLSIPSTMGVQPVYYDGYSGSDVFAEADASAKEKVAEFLLVQVIDANTIRLARTARVVTAAPHGGVLGGPLYLQDDGSLGVAPGSLEQKLASVVGPNELLYEVSKGREFDFGSPNLLTFDTAAAGSLSVSIPYVTSSVGIHYIDWGDGNREVLPLPAQTGTFDHTYAGAGVYVIELHISI